jgi:two-component system, NarL family, invasion response regulator UvrY
MSKKPITVVIADDHRMMLTGFATELRAHGITVLAACTKPADGLRLFEEHSPDVFIADIRFGVEVNGLMLAKEILAKHSQAKIVFLSQFSELDVIKEAYRLGGMGYLTKDCEIDELVTGIASVAEGVTYFMPSIQKLLATAAVFEREEKDPRKHLSDRELRVFCLQAEGLTLPEIAVKLSVSLKTASNDATAIKDKLGLTRPAQITIAAIKSRLLTVA